MDRLALYMAMLTGSSIAGAVVIAGLSLGYYSVWTIVIAGIAGALLAWPTGYVISRWIKRDDPDWTPEADPDTQSWRPTPNAPEV